MFSLRKRAKLLESIEETANSNEQLAKSPNEKHFEASLARFAQLPLELHFYLQRFLSIKETIKMRMLNKSFKCLIDSNELMWKNNVRLNLKVDPDTDLTLFKHFMQLKGHQIDYIRLYCPIPLNKQMKACIKDQQQPTSSQNRSLDANNNSDHTLYVHIKCINLLSLDIANLFANDCRHLTIDSFVNGNGNSGQIKNSKYLSCLSNLDVMPFTQLESLDMFCMLHDQKLSQYFIWNNVFVENPLLNRSHIIFSNLRELHLRFYMDSTRDLIMALKRLKNLKEVEFEYCNPVNDLNEVSETEQEAENENLGQLREPPMGQIQKIQLNYVSLSFALSILQSMDHKQSIESLSMFIKYFYFPKMELDLSRQDRQQRKLFRVIKTFKNLSKLSTNLWHVALTNVTNSSDLPALMAQQIQLQQMPFKLNELDLLEEPEWSLAQGKLSRGKSIQNKRFKLIDRTIGKFDFRDFNLIADNTNASSRTNNSRSLKDVSESSLSPSHSFSKLSIQFNLSCEEQTINNNIEYVYMRFLVNLLEKFQELDDLTIKFYCMRCSKTVAPASSSESDLCKLKNYLTTEPMYLSDYMLIHKFASVSSLPVSLLSNQRFVKIFVTNC